MDAESLKLARAGSLVTVVSSELSENGTSTVRDVVDDMDTTVLVSGLVPVSMVIRSPTTSSVVNRVDTPVTVADAVVSMDPVRVEDALPVLRKSPARSKVARGEVVPMPTLPALVMRIASAKVALAMVANERYESLEVVSSVWAASQAVRILEDTTMPLSVKPSKDPVISMPKSAAPGAVASALLLVRLSPVMAESEEVALIMSNAVLAKFTLIYIVAL